MNVLMISGDPRIVGGGEEAGKRMADYAHALGNLTVILLVRKKGTSPPSSPNLSIEICSGKFLRFIRAFTKGRQLLNENRYDVMTAQSVEHAFIAFLLSRRYRIPWQMQVHTDILSPYFWRESLANKIRVLLTKFLAGRADGIRVVSERVKNSFLAYRRALAPKIEVLPIWVHIEAVERKEADVSDKPYLQDRFVVLMASRITKEKNIGLAISAIEKVVTHHPEVLLLIVGEGPEIEKLKVKSLKLKVGVNVRFEPWTEHLTPYYQAARAFLITSNYEGYGRTAVEALAAGLPVVMTDVGVAGEIVQNDDNGFVTPVGDENALVEALEKMYKNPLKPSPLKTQTEEEYLKLYIDNLKLCIKR